MRLEAARVLVVEDNRDTSALLRDLLEGEGYEVASVASGGSAAPSRVMLSTSNRLPLRMRSSTSETRLRSASGSACSGSCAAP